MAASTLTLATLCGTSCSVDEPTPTNSATQAVINAPLPADLSLMLNSKTTLSIGPFDLVLGDVGASGPKGSVLFDVSAQQFGGTTAANTVVIRTGALAGNVYGNDLTVDGSAASQILGLDPSDLPQVPANGAVTPGTTSLTVAANQARQLCPGQYGAITLGNNATLNLNGGVYQISRLSLADGAKLLPSEPVVLLITGGITTTTGAVIDAHPQSLSPLTAGDIRIEAGGAVTIGNSNQIRAHILSAGKLTTGTGLILNGAFAAKSIAIGASAQLFAQDTLAAHAASVPPPCNDHNACTTDTCVGGGTAIAFCRNTPVTAGTSCEDGNLCNGAEVCDAAGSCSAGTPLAAGASCADGDLCNGNETCDGVGSCTPGAPPVVDDGNTCTTDSCDPLAGVSHAQLPDGSTCSIGGTCAAGVCSVQATIYSQNFTQFQDATTQCDAWNDFLFNQLTFGSYHSVSMSGTFDPTGATCNDPAAATQICQALHAGSFASVFCNGHVWNVGSCAGSTEIELDLGVCFCEFPGHSVRPCVGFGGEWGGINTTTCSGDTQNMTVSCE